MKNVIFSAARYLPPPPDPSQVKGVMRLWSLYDNELINDVTEKFTVQPLYGASQVMNQVTGTKLQCESNRLTDVLQDQESYYIAPNTPFCIQFKGRFTAAPTAGNDGFRMGVWPEGGTVGLSSWAIQVLNSLQVRFQITDTTGNTVATVTTLSGALSLNVDFHIAVERDANNKVTIYIDGVEKASSTVSIGSSRVPQRFTVQRGGIGAIWDMALSNDVVFGGPFTPPARFVKEVYAPKYSSATGADIVAQFAFRRDDMVNEVNGKAIACTGWSSMRQGQLYTGAAATDQYTTDIDYFGAGDFTYEMKFRIPVLPSDHINLPCQYDGTAGVSAQRYRICVAGTALIVAFMAAGNQWKNTLIPSAIAAGMDYHLVIERIGDVAKIYLNGVERSSLSIVGALPNPTGNKLTNMDGTTAFAAHYIWDIRIAKRAMYNGAVVTDTVLPRMPVDYKAAIPNFTVRVGGSQTVNGLMRGFAKNFLYANTSLSYGELYPQVYWNSAQNRMVRIKAITSQAGGLIVLAHAPSNEPRQADTPVMTNVIKIGNETFNMVTGTPAGKANINDTCVYYGSVIEATWPTDEEMKTISFV